VKNFSLFEKENAHMFFVSIFIIAGYVRIKAVERYLEPGIFQEGGFFLIFSFYRDDLSEEALISL
jgi:hypothetical protein